MPSDTGDDDTFNYLLVETEDIKWISEYTGLDFEKCLELNCYEFKRYFKDAFIFKYKQTTDGKEYLENCWLLQQTSPDRNKLRKWLGGEEND